MVLRRVGILSAGKISGMMGIVVGLIAGGIFAVIGLVGGAMQLPAGANAPQIPEAFLGVGAIIILPLFYGVMGFISGIIYAAFYNLVAGIIGGLEVEFEQLGPA